MTSADSLPGTADLGRIAGCEPGGGGGGGGGDGGAVPPGGTPPDDPALYDYDPNMAPPDCTKSVLANWEHAYCTSQPPTGKRLTRTLSALERIALRGGECANIASVGRGMLNSGMIRYFQHDAAIHGSYGGWGDPDLGALLASYWVDDFGGTALGAPNVDNKLIHEIEHAMGRVHYPEEGSGETPNSLRCSGLG